MTQPPDQTDRGAGEDEPQRKPWSWEPSLPSSDESTHEPEGVGREMLERLRERGLLDEQAPDTPSDVASRDMQPPPLSGEVLEAADASEPQPAWSPPPQAPEGPYPMVFDIEYPESLSRWTTFLRGFLILPVLLVLGLVQYFVQFGLLIGFTTVFWKKKYPHWLFSGVSGAYGYTARSYAYWLLQTDHFPSFSPEASPVTLEYDEPPSGNLSRWRVLLWKTVLLAPHYLVLSLLMLAVFAVTVMAWFAILFTGRYPRGIFQFTVGVQRWYWRTAGYMASFNDRFPPYALSASAGPAGNTSTGLSGFFGALIVGGFATLIGVSIALSNNYYTADGLSYAKVQAGTQQPAHRFKEELGNDEVLLRLTRAVDPGDQLAEIIRPASSERVVVMQWTVVNGTGSGALVARDAARLTYEVTDRGETTRKSVNALVIGVNNVAAPAKVAAFGTASLQAVFVIPEDAEVVELRFHNGFARGGVKYVFD